MKNLIPIFLQIIPVMIGVYLGFVISNWDQNRKNKQRADTFVENILTEIADNQAKIERVIEYHKMLRDSSAFFLKQPPEKLKRPDYFRGLQMPRLMNSAFLTGVQTGILNDLPVNKIQALNQLYSFQDIYNDFNNMTISGLLNLHFSQDADDLYKITIFINTTMNDVVEFDHALLEFYGLAKSRLNEE